MDAASGARQGGRGGSHLRNGWRAEPALGVPSTAQVNTAANGGKQHAGEESAYLEVQEPAATGMGEGLAACRRSVGRAQGS